MVKKIGGIFSIVGLVISIGSAYCYWTTQDLLNTGLRSQGKVVEMRRSGNKNIYTPVIQFETTEHKIITAASKIGSNPPTHKVNDSVFVLYRADSPEDFRLDEPLELWLLTCIVGAPGLVFITVGSAMLAYSIGRASKNTGHQQKTNPSQNC